VKQRLACRLNASAAPRITAISPEDWTAITLTLRIAAVATLASLPVAIGFAYLLARANFPGKSLLDGLLHLPLVLPPVVTGYLLLLAFGRNGPAGAFLHDWFGITLSFRWTGAALAAAVMSFPLMLRAIRLSFEAIDRRLEAAAGSLGANPLWTFLLVSLPLAAPGVLAGTILGFAKALGEFGATITFVSAIPGETRTVASAIYGYTQVPGGDGPAIQLMLISAAIALGAVIVSEALNRRMLRRLGVHA
jgi:molybdate transport system permease protein